MSAPRRTTAAWIARGAAWRTFYFLTDAAARAATGFLAAAAVLALWDVLSPLPEAARRIAWSAALGLAGLWALRALGRPGLSARRVAADLGAALTPRDLLVNLHELSRAADAGAAPFLARERAAFARQEAALRPARLMRPPAWGRRLTLAALLLGAAHAAARLSPGTVRVLWPWAPEAPWVEAAPGDARVPAGGAAALRFRVLQGPPRGLRLEVKGPAGWEERPLALSSDGTFHAALERLSSPVDYRVRRGLRVSRAWRVGVYAPPRLASFRVTARPPAYTSLPAETWEDAYAFTVPAGAALDARGAADRPLAAARLIAPDGAARDLAADGAGLSFSFRPRAGGVWTLFLVDREGLQAAVPLTVDVLPDAPPVLRLLSPEGSVAAGAREAVPVVFEVSDDHGLAGLRLVVRPEGGTPIARDLPPDAGLREVPLVPGRLGLAVGARARAHLEARDGNPAAPGPVVSEAFALAVTDAAGERRRREEALSRWREALLAARTDEALIRDKAVGAAPAWTDLAARQRLAEEGLSELAGSLESLVKDMEADPSADPWLAAEHRAAADLMRGLQAGALPRARAALAGARGAEAAAALEEVVKGLDRAAAASEAADRAARARALGRQDALAEAAEALGGALADGAEAQALLAELAAALTDIARALQELPGFLSEAPPDVDPSRVLRMDEMMGDLAEVQEALARGDAAAARAAADRFAAKARALRDLLARAAAEGGGPAGAPALAQAFARLADRARALADRQEGLISRAQRTDDGAHLRRRDAAPRPPGTPAPPLFDAADLRELAAQSADQAALKAETAGLSGELEALLSRTLLAPEAAAERLREAEGLMGAAAGSLSSGDPAAALPAQREALRRLREGAERFSSPLQPGAGAPAGRPGGTAGRGLPPGAAGSPTGPTRLPRVDDYRPPPAFREDLLRALEEKYPSRERGVIEEYFKRWRK